MPTSEANTWLIVPCFNEAHRWSEDYWLRVASITNLHVLLVNDGSTDSTGSSIELLAAKAPNATTMNLPANAGKGNAVRQGLLAAMDHGAASVGFIDADGAFDPAEIPEIMKSFTRVSHEDPPFEALWTSRVALAGRAIHRRTQRHYIGRIVATLISTGLPGVPYDTQCGFKIFTASLALQRVLSRPFTTRWLFDVEILQRWWEETGQPMRVWEEPLMSWHDVPGSAITSGQALTVAREVAFIARENRRIAAQQGKAPLH